MRHARHRVNQAHAVAATKPDPVAYMHQCLAEAEQAWCYSGTQQDLALVRAFEESLQPGCDT